MTGHCAKEGNSPRTVQQEVRRGWSQDGGLGGRGIRVSAPTRPQRGTADTSGDRRSPQRPGRTRGMGGSDGGGEVEAGRDWCPWGAAGGGEGSPRRKGEIGGPLGGQRIKTEHGQVSPAHLGPQEPAEILGLILCPPGPLQPRGS